VPAWRKSERPSQRLKWRMGRLAVSGVAVLPDAASKAPPSYPPGGICKGTIMIAKLLPRHGGSKASSRVKGFVIMGDRTFPFMTLKYDIS
jgi:hypothetical protein